ncbi:MAG TPA: DUF177 domain-containing protein [Rhodothermales bacterium]|nr:DUF177 domain-containing protein [Rhodothermales bacterium]
MLQIKISSLKPGIHRFQLEPEAEAVDLDPCRFEDIHVDVHLDYHEERIFVKLSAHALATLQCDRTLVDFKQQLDGAYSLLFAEPDVAASGTAGSQDVRVLHPSDQEIDLTDAVRDTILLAIPARCIAPGAEDEAIPMQFGAVDSRGDYIDPRWEALRKLKDSSG